MFVFAFLDKTGEERPAYAGREASLLLVHLAKCKKKNCPGTTRTLMEMQEKVIFASLKTCHLIRDAEGSIL